jgi:hypothetical protein
MEKNLAQSPCLICGAPKPPGDVVVEARGWTSGYGMTSASLCSTCSTAVADPARRQNILADIICRTDTNITRLAGVLCEAGINDYLRSKVDGVADAARRLAGQFGSKISPDEEDEAEAEDLSEPPAAARKCRSCGVHFVEEHLCPRCVLNAPAAAVPDDRD